MSTLIVSTPGQVASFEVGYAVAEFLPPETATDPRQLLLSVVPGGDDWQRIYRNFRRGAAAGELTITIEPDDEEDQDKTFRVTAGESEILIEWTIKAHQDAVGSPVPSYWSMEFLITGPNWQVSLSMEKAGLQ